MNVKKENEASGQKGMRATSVQAVEAGDGDGDGVGKAELPAEETWLHRLGG